MSGPTDGLLPILPDASACAYGSLDGPAGSRSRLGRLRITTPPLICIVALLAGCATAPQTPLLAHVETQIVKVPVNVRCVSLQELPVIPKTRMATKPAATSLAQLQQQIEQWVIEVQIDMNNLEDYVVRADAILRACAAEPQPSTDPKAKP